LITGTRFMPQYHSEHHHYGTGMREVNPDPIVDLNTIDAGKYGIKEGDWVYIETRRGKIKQKARVSDKMLAGVVNCQAGWWFPEMPAEDPCLHGVFESNANVLTLDDLEACDPLSGGWQTRALLCKIYKV
jgi:anaerobic selenocysteine-containing dehydrogenase